MQKKRTYSVDWVKYTILGLLMVIGLTARAEQLFDVTGQALQPPSPRPGKHRVSMPRPAAIWLTPTHEANAPVPAVAKNFTLLQKNKQFSPHLLIVPTGSMVHFPNADPFFHNVFSLFNGRRFDLGLYEAGSSKEVLFSREGVSYIFCNIHPEMSAVVIALNTPFYATEDAQGRFHIAGVPAGDYMLHLWVEGSDPAATDLAPRRVRIATGHTDLGEIELPQIPQAAPAHDNKYGQKYDPHDHAIY